MATERTPLLPPSTSSLSPERPPAGETPADDVLAAATAPAIQPREHYLDNLRAILTVLLVIHHGVTETIHNRHYDPPKHFLSLSIFARVVFVAFIAPTFFVISGRVAAIQLSPNCAQANPDRAFFKNRTLWVLLPAIFYAVVGQLILFLYLTSWEKIFGGLKSGWAFIRLDGPVVYVFFVGLFDYVYLLVRYMRRKTWSFYVDRWIASKSREIFGFVPSSVRVGIVALAIVVYTFLQCIGRGIYPVEVMNFVFWSSYDSPTPDAPLSFIGAYLVGVYLEEVEAKFSSWFGVNSPSSDRVSASSSASDIEAIPRETATLTPTVVTEPEPSPQALSALNYTTLHPLLWWTLMFLSILFTTVSLTLAQSLSPSILRTIYNSNNHSNLVFVVDGGFNPHTIFYVLWSLFTVSVTPILLVLAFKSTGWTNRSWGLIVRRTYAQTYFHFIPILVAIFALRHLDSNRYLLLNAILVGVMGVVGSWFLVAPIFLYDIAKRRWLGLSGWRRGCAVACVYVVYILLICFVAPCFFSKLQGR